MHAPYNLLVLMLDEAGARLNCKTLGTDPMKYQSCPFLLTDLPVAPHLSSVSPLSMSSVLVTWQPAGSVSNDSSSYFVIQFKQK